MKCIIPGINVKVFGRAVHSLSKIGEEIYFEPLDDGLALRTVNLSRSAFASFIFRPSFFSIYDDGHATLRNDDDVLKCKIGMKSCLSIFRSLSSLEKSVDRCKITLNMDDCRLVFQLFCRHGIVKTFNLTFIECETLQAVFSKEKCNNVLTAQTRLLCDAVTNFQASQEEVTLIVSKEKVSFKNYIEDEPDLKKVVHTVLDLVPEEFDLFQIDAPADITFCLKELRAVLTFSEAANMPVTMRFDVSGRPIAFCIDSDSTFEGNFLLATLADYSSQSQVTASSQVGLTPQTQGQRSKPSVSAQRSTARRANNGSSKSKTALKNMSKVSVEPPTQSDQGNEDRILPISLLGEPEPQRQDSPTNIEEEGTFVPGTPPGKRFKSLFFGMSQSTTTGSQPSSTQHQVLAADTDDEGD
ncbi:hypothetical protein CAPTEDRAFT_148357 [Capitella teleta]|uniref:Cell cycle checkpoint control protein n=1 Tax=Capitella teleta TaxID=283909 RepID=R7TDX8_CAPTE|nr:hypothetical protein CAPTEDRAFT_148357 [Capitella teleta]|eukprot:ELT91717.1 hypothetical protein CAPTEDRAFT_148357 [Capitella teleta]